MITSERPTGRAFMPPNIAEPVVAVATASDSKFFPHLNNLLETLRLQHQRHEVFVVDVGLRADELDRLSTPTCSVIAPGGFVFDDFDTARPYLEVRPSLNNLLSDTDIIVWLDADIWIQSPTYLADLVGFLRRYEFLVSPQLHPAYGHANFDARFRRSVHRYGYLSGWNFDKLYESYGRSVAYKLAKRSVLNGGVFAGWTHSAFWDYWKAVYRRGAKARNDFGIDQLALNVTASIFEGPVGLLPASYNWLCHFAPPAYDREQRRFVDPVLPHDCIHALHLASRSKDEEIPIAILGGEVAWARLSRTEIVRGVWQKEELFGASATLPPRHGRSPDEASLGTKA
jgi:hypothetical protein